MTYVWIALAAAVAWTLSTLAGGGAALLLVPVVTLLLGPKATAPIITILLLVNQPVRAVIMRNSIRWDILKWFVPAAVIGAISGAWVFASIKEHWLQLVIGVFLIAMAAVYAFSNSKRLFTGHAWYFAPAGFVFSFISGLIGSTGPILNPLYLGMKVEKQAMVGTKSAGATVMNIVKIVSYLILGSLSWRYVWYGADAAAAALVTNWIARKWLKGMSSSVFRMLVIGIMALAGVMMIWRQHGALVSGWHALFG